MPTILVADDRPNQRLLLQMELEDDGYDVVVAPDGREALLKAQSEQPDLVVLDIAGPGGIEALESIFRMALRPLVVIYSGTEAYRDDPVARMADAYVIKNSNVDVLKETVRRVLSGRLLGSYPDRMQEAVAA